VSIVHPHSGFRVIEREDALVVELPSPRRPVTALALSLWLVGWAFGLAFIVRQFEPGDPTPTDRGFLLVWGAAWLLAGGVVMAWLAWLVAGSERVTLSADALQLEYGGFGRYLGRRYPLDGIRELRTFGREVPPLLAAGLDFTGRGASGVRFRNGERVVRFARALDEHAAHALVARLRTRHAFGEGPAPSPGGRSESPAA